MKGPKGTGGTARCNGVPQSLGPPGGLANLRTLTPERARRAYLLNAFLVSLRLPTNRTAFQQDEHACMVEFGLSNEECTMVIERAYAEMLDYGVSPVALGKAAVALGATLVERGLAECGLTLEELIAQKRASKET